jgi:hypothetical protein
MCFQQSFPSNHEDAVVAAARLRPREGQLRERTLHALARVSDFHDQHAAGSEPRRRFSDDAPNEIEAVAATRERKRRLFPVLRGQRTHRASGHIRRVRRDEVILLRAKR